MLTVENLTKAYDQPRARRGAKRAVDTAKLARRFAVENVSFSLKPGEIFTLLGPSGCGKTTTLRSIAGLEVPNSGTIAVDGRVLFDSAAKVSVAANDRRLGMVFQSYAIWPHLSVFRNVSFPLEALPRRERPGKAEIRKRVSAALEATALAEFADRSATALSGGQQQRLALARALVVNPPLLLLDEPLSNLDAKLRESMRFEIKRLQREFGLTCVYVTHDQTEALTLSDRIAVMNEGHVVQIGEPSDVYERPNSHFVADFIGTTNFIEGTIKERAGDLLSIETTAGVLQSKQSATADVPGSRVTLSIRPESIALAVAGTAADGWRGEVTARVFEGDTVEHIVRVGDIELRNRVNPDQAIEVGRSVTVSVPADRVVVVR